MRGFTGSGNRIEEEDTGELATQERVKTEAEPGGRIAEERDSGAAEDFCVGKTK